MNAAQRRKVRRNALRWLPKMARALNEIADAVERGEVSASELRKCAFELETVFRDGAVAGSKDEWTCTKSHDVRTINVPHSVCDQWTQEGST